MIIQNLTFHKQLDCCLIVLEDVDCLFEHTHKPHDSAKTLLTLLGLLNCMDWLLHCRAEGLIMFLTANMTRQCCARPGSTSRWPSRTRIVSMRARASCFTRPSSDGRILKRSGRRFGRGLCATSSRLRCSSSFFQGRRWKTA